MMNAEGRTADLRPMRPEDGGRRILNTNLEVLNRVNKEDSIDHIVNTLEEILEIMIPHCGPRSRYATIITNSGREDFEPSIFTKDGANILSFLEFASPIQSYVKQFVEYIGRRVDNEAKDGTTTAIVFTSMFLLSLLKDDKFDPFLSLEKLDTMTTTEVSNLFRSLYDDILKALKTPTLQVDQLTAGTSRENASLLAFIQAMSSSGGDTLLADCMRRIFLSSPKEGWDRLTVTQSVLEGGEPFRVKYREYDYRLYAALDIDEVLNANLNTGYEQTDVTVLVYADALSFGISALDAVTDYLETVPDTPHLVLAKSFDARLISYVKKLNKDRKAPIALFSSMEDDGGRRSLDMEALCHMSGAQSYANDPVGPIGAQHLFHAQKATFYGNYLELYHIFDRSETDTLHPFMEDLDAHPGYRDFLSLLNQIVDSSKQGHVKNGKLVESANRVFKQMTCIGVPELYVGGDTHTNLSNMSVQQDVQGATIASLSHGFLCSGLLAFAGVITRMRKHYELDSLRYAILTHMQHAIDLIVHIVYGDEEELPVLHCAWEATDYVNALCLKEQTNVRQYIAHLKDVIDAHPVQEDLLNALKDDTYICTNYPPVQPATVYKELLARTHELTMRVLLMDKIIVPGGAYISKS